MNVKKLKMAITLFLFAGLLILCLHIIRTSQEESRHQTEVSKLKSETIYILISALNLQKRNMKKDEVIATIEKEATEKSMFPIKKTFEIVTKDGHCVWIGGISLIFDINNELAGASENAC